MSTKLNRQYAELVPQIEERMFLWEYAGVAPKGRSYCPDANCSGARSRDTQFNDRVYHCYICKQHGDLVKYVSTKTGLGFSAAVRELADYVGLSLSPPPDRVKILQQVCAAAHQNLIMGPSAHKQLYWNNRGITSRTLIQQGIGYIDLESECLDQINPDDLLKIGIMQQSRETKGLKCIFNARWTFPIRNERGDLVQIKARSDEEVLGKEAPKNLALQKNPAQSPRDWGNFSHLNYLYLEEHLKHYDKSYVIITEGEPDALTLKQMGFQVVGLQTCQGLDHHVTKLSQFKKIYILLDNDVASQKFMTQELFKLQLKLRDQSTVYRCLLPIVENTKKTDVNDLVVHYGKTKDFFENAFTKSPTAYKVIIEDWAPNAEDFDVIRNLGTLVRSANSIHQERMIKYISKCSGIKEDFIRFAVDPKRVSRN
jgi:DNA primase